MMQNNRTRFVFMALVLVLSLPAITLERLANARSQEVTVTGRVVAELRTVASLMQLTDVPNLQIVIVRTEESRKHAETPRYLKVHYEYSKEESSLSKEVLDARKEWRFRLKRDPSCDGSLKDFEGQTKSGEQKDRNTVEISLPGLVKTPGAESESIPDSLTLPCYILRPRGLKAIGKK